MLLRNLLRIPPMMRSTIKEHPFECIWTVIWTIILIAVFWGRLINRNTTEQRERSELPTTIASYLADQGLNYTYNADHAKFCLSFELPPGTVECRILTRKEERQIVVFSQLPDAISKGRLTQAVEYLTRVNCFLPVGNFELNYNDGRVHFKTCLDLGDDGVLTSEMVHQLIEASIVNILRYTPGLRNVLNGTKTPEAALQAVESEQSPSRDEDSRANEWGNELRTATRIWAAQSDDRPAFRNVLVSLELRDPIGTKCNPSDSR